jgi:hypothetical protein
MLPPSESKWTRLEIEFICRGIEKVWHTMGWEPRRNSRRYFYKSVRTDGRARKIYLGSGGKARAEAKAVAMRNRERLADREAMLLERSHLEAACSASRDLGIWADLLASVSLLLANFHRRRGEWRKRRKSHGSTNDRAAAKKEAVPPIKKKSQPGAKGTARGNRSGTRSTG